MSKLVNAYSTKLVSDFEKEKIRIRKQINSKNPINHIGSSAIGIGGKNIIDILIGAKNKTEMILIHDSLKQIGYFEGNDSHQNRIFMSSRKEETVEGDFHIHICLIDSNEYKNFLIFKKYLINNQEIAKEYLAKKQEFAKQAKNNRRKYKKLKSIYIQNFLKKINEE